MSEVLERMQEISNRGLQDNLPPDKRAIFDEAINRGLIKTQDNATSGTDYGTMGAGDVAVEAMQNIPASAKRFGGEIYEAVTNPLETGKALGSAAVGALASGNVAFNELTGQESTAETERIASKLDPIKEYLSGRYTSMDGFKQSIAQDPVGVLADFASVLTGVGGVAKAIPKLAKVGAAVERVGSAVEPLNVARKATVGLIPKILPESLYQSAAKFSTGKKLSSADRKKITRLAVGLGVEPTPKGLSKAWSYVNHYADQVDGIIDDAVNTGDMIDVTGAVKNIDDLKEQIWANFPEPQPYMKVLDKLKANFVEAHKQPKTARQVQDLKKGIYNEISNYYDPSKGQVTGPSAAKIKGKKEVAKFLRERLEQIHPEIKSLNANEGSLLKLIDALEQPVKRIENRDIFSIGLPLKSGVGAAVGGPVGAAVGALAGLLDTPKVKAKLAITLERARKIGRMKDKSTQARLAARAAGKEEEL